MIINKARIEQIKALFDRATPGPWEVWDGCSWRRIGRVGHQGERPIIEPYVSRSDGHPDLMGPNGQNDLKFMAASWQAVSDLLAYIDQQAAPPAGATEIEARLREIRERREKVDGAPWTYFKDGQNVFGKSGGGCNKEMSEYRVADIRGWGHLQYMGDTRGDAKACALQDAQGEFIAAAPADVSFCLDTIAAMHAENERLGKLVFVPGAWRCAKCNFQLIQSNLNARDGTVTARDEPGDKCPNDGSPLWRVSYRDEFRDVLQTYERRIDEFTAQAKRIEALGKALAFASCVIKSGESWSSTCEEIIGGALHG